MKAGMVALVVGLLGLSLGLSAYAQPAAPPGKAATPAPGEKAATQAPAAQRFKNNPLFRADFVPIMVNCQSLTNAKIYHDAGVNIYDLIDDVTETPKESWEFKPTAETLKILGDLGMYAIVDQKIWASQRDNPIIIGWECPVDEPDNVQDNSGKAMPLDAFLAESKKLKASDPTRPYIVCFGQGVINDLFKGRGIDRAEYPKYVEPVDVIHYDVYPITNSRRPDGEKYLDLVGQGVSRIRGWTKSEKPVMCWIETTHIGNKEKKPTPAQTNCEVWDTMVHGARGVGYFCHDFTLESRKASALSRDKAMLEQLAKTNAKLQKLARVITAPLATEPAEAKCDAGKVIYSTKKLDGATAVLAENLLDDKAKATLAVAGLKKGARIEVLEEGREIEASDGAFTDEFAPYQEHVYKIKG